MLWITSAGEAMGSGSGSFEDNAGTEGRCSCGLSLAFFGILIAASNG